jgi:hypothetical protein
MAIGFSFHFFEFSSMQLRMVTSKVKTKYCDLTQRNSSTNKAAMNTGTALNYLKGRQTVEC